MFFLGGFRKIPSQAVFGCVGYMNWLNIWKVRYVYIYIHQSHRCVCKFSYDPSWIGVFYGRIHGFRWCLMRSRSQYASLMDLSWIPQCEVFRCSGKNVIVFLTKIISMCTRWFKMTCWSPIVEGHLSNLWRGHVNSPSQKGHCLYIYIYITYIHVVYVEKVPWSS